MVDNIPILAWINKTAQTKTIFGIVKASKDLCVQRNIRVQASSIVSKQNKVVDNESRKLHDNLE